MDFKKTEVGGTKKINIKEVCQVKPDLIIANKEENEKEQIEISSKDFPVWVTDVHTLKDALKMISDVGELTGKASEASLLISQISHEFSKLHISDKKIRTAYLIWKDPYMTIGGDTFINDMMKYCGLQNIFETKKRYPVIDLEDLKTSGCQLLLLSSEPYPFKEMHLKELQQHFPGVKIMLADGEMFSWYGSRLLQAPKYFEKLIKVIGS